MRLPVPCKQAGDTGAAVYAAVLMGSSAGDFMTGQTIVIDGGATIS